MSCYLNVLRKYADFSGRARRKEFWMFILFSSIFSIIAVILDNIFGIANRDTGYGLITQLYSLAMVLPTLAVIVRRLHDTGKSGWWFFIDLIPLLGFIWMLVLLVTEGQGGENQYGPDPKRGQL